MIKDNYFSLLNRRHQCPPLTDIDNVLKYIFLSGNDVYIIVYIDMKDYLILGNVLKRVKT